MGTTTLQYIALPGQITMGVIDPLVNTEPCPLYIEGYAIPAHIDGDGHPLGAGFDIVSIKLAATTEFASAQAAVYASVGQELHWRQCPQAVQWADRQVGSHGTE